VVDSEQYLLTLLRYIELNPVRAGMVAPERLPAIVPGGGFERRFAGNPGLHVQGLGAGRRAVQGRDRAADATPYRIEGGGAAAEVRRRMLNPLHLQLQ